MRRLVWALLFVCLAAHAGQRVPSYHYRAATSGAALSFLVAGGGAAGMMSNTDSTFANAYSSDVKQGNWFLLQGDGESEPGGLTLSAVGSPETQALRTCGNGAYCGSVTGQRTNGAADGWASGVTTAPAGDFYGCWMGSVDSVASAPMLMTLDSNTGSLKSWALLANTSAAPVFQVFKTDAVSTSFTVPAALTPRATHVVCFAYDFVADGSSLLHVWLDGTKYSTSPVGVGPAQAVTTPRFHIAMRDTGGGGSLFLPGRTNLAFYATGTIPSDATFTSMASALLGAGLNVYAADGTALTISRASPISCPWDENWSGLTVIPPGRPCVTMGGLLAAPGATNLVLRNEEIDNASWLKSGLTSVAASAEVGLDGSPTADKMIDDTSTGSHRIRQPITKAASAIQYTHCVSLMADEMTYAIVGLSNSTESAASYQPIDLSTCTLGSITNVGFTGPSGKVYDGGNGWCRVGLTTTSDTDTVIQPTVWISSDNTFAGRSYTGQGFGIYVWGDTVETGSTCTPPIRTEASTVTRVAQAAYFITPSSMSDSRGCISAISYTFGFVSAGARILETVQGRIYQNTSTSMNASDGTNFPGINGTAFAGSTVSAFSTWGPGGLTLGRDGVTASTAYDGTMLGATIALGATAAGGSPSYSVIRDVVFGTSEGGCQ